jgi:hypothetical protein
LLRNCKAISGKRNFFYQISALRNLRSIATEERKQKIGKGKIVDSDKMISLILKYIPNQLELERAKRKHSCKGEASNEKE